MYDAVLQLQLREGAEITGFADNLTITTVAKHLEEVKLISSEAIKTIRRWLISVGLQLVDNKTEVVLITSRKKTESLTLTVGHQQISSQPCLKYLGVWVEERLRFDTHLRNSSDKAAGVAAAPSGTMPNVGGPRQSRRLIAGVISSILLYAAPSGRTLLATYIRCITAGVPLIERMAEERQRIHRMEAQEKLQNGVLSWNTIQKDERKKTLR
ncbi:hypothetical protein J437_LFUL014683 [Ladona fulva]|uniref:Reverse transcriptase domain-containing protein n=1 Tax=Ladona fulva TaxID=123851 RepID=A0A8K0KAN2_LADFU|nr:hypothetical protein J437_LFUL014683 [Ladona fulva]